MPFSTPFPTPPPPATIPSVAPIPDIALRLAQPSDLDIVTEIRRTAILALAPSRMTLEAATAWANRPDRPDRCRSSIEAKKLWLAYEGTDAVGWFEVSDDFVDGLYVVPSRQGAGVGSTLMGVVEIMIKDRDFEAARLNTAPASQGFYEKLGYEVMGPAPMGSGMRMWKVLPRTARA